MATDPQAVAAAMEVLGCRQGVFWCVRPAHHPAGHWTDAGCPVTVAVVEAVTPTIAARALEDAAEALDRTVARWQHGGGAMTGVLVAQGVLRTRAAETRQS